MRMVWLIAAIAMLGGATAVAQPAASTSPPAARSAQTPIDHGPFTPEANAAFQGGGMILQGAPGAPPPRPEPTPPGPTPRHMVKP